MLLCRRVDDDQEFTSRCGKAARCHKELVRQGEAIPDIAAWPPP